MILYHGTNVDFETIDLSKSKPNKDFGQGFYLSADYNQAMDMAKTKVEQLETGTPIVLAFEVDEQQMAKLKIQHYSEYSEDWAKFILLNRRNSTHKPVHDYDIVIGPIANDRVGVQIRRFQDKAIDIDQFVAALQYMRGITFQYAFCTDKAIQTLQRL